MHVIFGPELFWLLAYGVVLAGIKFSGSPVKSMDSTWIAMAYIVPLILVPLSFGFYLLPGITKSWLLTRVLISGLIGSHFVLNRALLAHSNQGPGVGTAYIVGMILVLPILFIGCVWVLIKFRAG